MRRASFLIIAVLVLACIVLINIHSIAQIHQAASAGNAPAESLTNPAKSDSASIAAGQKVYQKSCAACHGVAGKGDGPVVASLKPEATRPANLADDKWEHGSTDSEIFNNIRDGIGPKFEMKGQKDKITDQDIWHLVNYLRSLGSKN